MLHSPGYRSTYVADLRKTLPRLPLLAEAHDFWTFVGAGRELATLHVGYEAIEPYDLQETRTSSGTVSEDQLYRVRKMRHPGHGAGRDRSTLVYNQHLMLSGIPDVVREYELGQRSALAWLIDRYQVSTDKASGLVDDPNDWAVERGQPRYIVDLVKRVVTVSVETTRLVGSLPALKVRF